MALERLWVLQIIIYALVTLGDYTPASVTFYLNQLVKAINMDVLAIFTTDTSDTSTISKFGQSSPYNDKLEYAGFETKKHNFKQWQSIVNCKLLDSCFADMLALHFNAIDQK